MIEGLPKRIVSLVPSLTELLYALGLEDEVVGITKFCVHPQSWFKNKTRIGGTKNVDVAKVTDLQPDLIIANKEENVKVQVEQLQQVAPVYLSDINTLQDALQAITTIGELTGRQRQAEEMVANIQDIFNNLPVLELPVATAYFIWRNPYMAAGNHTFIHDLLLRCGFANIYAGVNRYPVIDFKSHLSPAALGCKLLLLSSEPYPFGPKHLEELRQQLPGCKILLVDGEMFSWYGSRLLKFGTYFQQIAKQL